MKLLLDTHIFLWWNAGDPKLPRAMRDEILSDQNTILVSAVTVWEIAIKRASGKLSFDLQIGKAIAGHGFSALDIAVAHAEWAGALPALHHDPFDRLLIAQAHIEGLVLATVDAQVLQYHVPHL
jgi:PIN domain nuclease of toxin-antitoxin system